MEIYKRINAVMHDVKYVQKDRKVQDYKAVTHDKVVSECRAAIVKHGIVIEVTQVDGGIIIPRDASKDIKMHLYAGAYDVSFVCIEDGSRATVRVNAHANDNGDKAPGKAMTYATKAAVLKMFFLETGEDEESRAGTDVDVDAILLEIDAITDIDALRAKSKEWAALCAKRKDVTAWAKIKAAGSVRAAELAQS